MESFLFLIDSVLIVLMIVSSVRNDRLRSGAKQTGLFRIADPAGPPPAAPRSRPKLPGPLR